MNNQLKSPPSRELNTALAEKKIDAGILGTVFGTGDQPAKFFSFFILIILLLLGTVLIFTQTWENAVNFWEAFILPILTLALGYLFGKS
jgi:hypothetical protein